MPRTGAAAAETRRALDAIQQVHDLPAGLPRVAITTGRGSRVAGRYALSSNGLALSELRVERDAEGKGLALLRRLGELIDTQSLYLPGRSAARSQAPLLAAWRQAVDQTQLVQDLDELAQHSDLYASAADRSTVFERSYAQWIATASGDVSLLAQIEVARESHPELWWSEDEFSPIASSLEQLVSRLGWKRAVAA
jgi:hypothetical protein